MTTTLVSLHQTPFQGPAIATGSTMNGVIPADRNSSIYLPHCDFNASNADPQQPHNVYSSMAAKKGLGGGGGGGADTLHRPVYSAFSIII